MKHLKFTIGIFLVLAVSRFIPHPPNFTSLIALSFYVPILFGQFYIFSLLFSFVITDLIIGMHTLTFFTWGAVVIIGFFSKLFIKNFKIRFFGVLFSILIFYIISNFGVWIMGSYGYSVEGFLMCYINAIPFLGNTFLSTILYSSIIETINKYKPINSLKFGKA